MLDVVGICVTFDGRRVLDDLSLHVDHGEVVAILGPSGAGKSTLAAGASPACLVPDSGTVSLDGVDITDRPAHHRRIGMIFQDEQLFPHLDVAANVGFGPRMLGWSPPRVAARVDELLHIVGLDGFGARRVDRLSGGEKKRVALARSLAPRTGAAVARRTVDGPRP